MSSPRTIFILTLAVFCGSLLSSCSASRRAAKEKPLRNRTPGFLVKKNEDRDFNFEWLGLKVSADVKAEGVSDSFKATVRMRKDSIIWLSISPALGVEMVRMIITPDSVKYVSKVPNNKHYYLGDFSVIEEVSGMPFDFNMIQNMVVGNTIMLDKGDDKLISMVDKQQYLLISRFDRKLKRVVGFDEKDMLPNTVLHVDPLDREYQKVLRRASVDELMCKRFWLHANTYRLERALYNDLYNLRDIEITYSDPKVVGGSHYSSKGKIRVVQGEEWHEMGFKISRLNREKEYDFPFDIPEDYERKY